ncbi:hypothetical protein CI088_01655 [Enterococcus plantarum]|uniref:Transposase IS204/IS1001/IS1096/IS1165 DDE domain-containing protein n=1 Tax=Enterococcus plantarum TaxID=1077675 RepID=A0A2W3ZCE3_9ENTE|nr:hypothetical protein CI088_01655 [Enterococcus plantarum]
MFDEFKSVKQVADSMSLIMMDGQTKQLIDVVENRQLPFLERYFSRFSLSVRKTVKYIVCDMYTLIFLSSKSYFRWLRLFLIAFYCQTHRSNLFKTPYSENEHISSSGKYRSKKISTLEEILETSSKKSVEA